MPNEAIDTRRKPAPETAPTENASSRRPAPPRPSPVRPAAPPRPSPRSALVAMLSTPARARQAILLGEILGPPKALQDPRRIGGVTQSDPP
jgi:hypothetical protein